jgi:hypothetical protein
MFKKSLLVVFVAIALFGVAVQVPAASAAAWCDQESGDCGAVTSSFNTLRPVYVYPNDPGLATRITPIFKADPLFVSGSAEAHQLPE